MGKYQLHLLLRGIEALLVGTLCYKCHCFLNSHRDFIAQWLLAVRLNKCGNRIKTRSPGDLKEIQRAAFTPKFPFRVHVLPQGSGD